MTLKRVAITGIGMVTPLGNTTKETWEALFLKKNGIDYIKSFNAEKFPCKIAGEVKNFNLTNIIQEKKKLKYVKNKMTEFGLAAAYEALIDARILPDPQTSHRWGCVVGSGMIPTYFDHILELHEKFSKNFLLDTKKFGTEGPSFFPPTYIDKFIPNACISLLVNHFKIHGYATSVHTACASGGQALGLGLQAIRRGDVDYVLAGGYDSLINPVDIGGFCLLGALSTHNDSPQTASRPFDLTRNGFVLSEGASFLVLELWEKAKERGARIYAELAGEGNSLSSFRITDSHPSGDGAIQAIEGALNNAHIDALDIDYINAHGTGTKMNDLSETNAIKAVFKKNAEFIPISSTKSQMGHMIAAAGAAEGAICALAIHHQKIPMTANLNHPDPECDLDFVSEGPREKAVRAALSNSFGFGGSNSCLAFLHPDFR